MPDQDEIKLRLPLRWVDDGSPLVVADQFIMRRHGNHIHLVVGHVGIPLLVGTPEEQQEQAHKMGALPVHVRGRFLLDKPSLVRLHAVLGIAIAEDEDNEVSDG